jgi:two-component sensor histidine kinase
VVQALAMQTDGGSVETFREAFTGRLQVLARAHSLLLDEQWRGAELEALVERVLEPYWAERPDRIAFDGEAVTLTPSRGLALSLVLHELATNATKYGALAVDEGRVEISWEIRSDSARSLHLRWRERGGPPVEPPQEKGFGTRLIERAVTHELQGEMELVYVPAGLHFEVRFPLT